MLSTIACTLLHRISYSVTCYAPWESYSESRNIIISSISQTNRLSEFRSYCLIISASFFASET